MMGSKLRQDKKNKNHYLFYSIVATFVINIVCSFQVFGGATWSTRTVDTPARTGGCSGSYTISLNVASSALNNMASGATVSITFNAATGIDATTCTGGTYNGTAIGSMTLTATTINFSAPVARTSGAAFTIVLNGIIHGPSVSAGTVSVSVTATVGSNTGTTTNSYTTSAFGGTTSSAGADQNVCATTATFAGNSVAAGETGVWSKISGSGTTTTPSSPTSGVTGLGSLANTFRWTITITATGCKSSDDVIITNNNDLSSVLAYASSNCPASNTVAELTLSSSPGTIQWQQNINGGGWTNIAGATTNPYNITGINATYTFRANVTTACGTYAISAAPAITSYGMSDFTGGNVNYATANASGDCYNNLTAGQTYCFSFVYSHYIEMDWQPNGCAACPDVYVKYVGGGVSSSVSTGSCSVNASSMTGGPGGCVHVEMTSCTSCGISMYDKNCGLIVSGGYQFGDGCASPAMVQGDVYYICFTVPATCGGMSMCPMINCTAGNCAAGPLPIELLYLNAVSFNDKVQLYWATATESNNDYFTVERTSDGENFTVVGKINGEGNSTSILNYNMVDDVPLEGVSYYRLKQTDYDGKYAYSKLVSINSESSDNNIKLAYFYVDNSNEVLRYGLDLFDNKNYSIQIIDVLGHVLTSQKLTATENTFRSIDISGLSKGVYFFKITGGSEMITKKFFR